MKKILTYVLLILITFGVTYVMLHDHFTGRLPWDPPSHSENTIQTKLYSKILKEDRELIIHLPRNYNSLTKYPIMYVLDGGSADESIAKTFDILSSAGCTPSTIIVGIPNQGENRQRDYTPPYLKMDMDEKESPLGKGDIFLSFIETELIPFMEKNYSVSQDRLFSGNSRGGLLVMHSLLYKPDLFQARFCFSSPFWRENQIIVSKVSDFLNSKDTLNTFVYMSVGEKETDNIKNGFSSMTKLFQEKAPYGFTWYSDYTKNADHQTNAEASAAVGIGKWSQYVNTKYESKK